MLPRTPPPVPRRSQRLNRRRNLNQTQVLNEVKFKRQYYNFQGVPPQEQQEREHQSRLSRTRSTFLSTLRWFRVENIRKLPSHIAHGFTIIKRQSIQIGRTAMAKMTSRNGTTLPENLENEHYYESIDPC